MLPRREISAVGTRFIEIRKSPGGEANVLPIPEEMQPMLHILGLLAAGRMAEAGASFDAALDADVRGWRVRLTPTTASEAVPGIALVGCGARLLRIDIAEPGGIERRYILGDG